MKNAIFKSNNIFLQQTWYSYSAYIMHIRRHFSCDPWLMTNKLDLEVMGVLR